MKKILILLCLLSKVCLGHPTVYGMQCNGDELTSATTEEYPSKTVAKQIAL